MTFQGLPQRLIEPFGYNSGCANAFLPSHQYGRTEPQPLASEYNIIATCIHSLRPVRPVLLPNFRPRFHCIYKQCPHHNYNQRHISSTRPPIHHGRPTAQAPPPPHSSTHPPYPLQNSLLLPVRFKAPSQKASKASPQASRPSHGASKPLQHRHQPIHKCQLLIPHHASSRNSPTSLHRGVRRPQVLQLRYRAQPRPSPHFSSLLLPPSTLANLTSYRHLCVLISEQGPVNHFPHLHLLSLPKTCRQIYIESLSSLYTLHPFQPATLSTVASLSRSLLPSRLSLIRHLNLNLRFCYPLVLYRDPLTNLSLDETWDIIATQMTGLKELDVFIIFHSHVGEWEAGERMVLSGLAKCRGLGTFKVRVLHLGRHQETLGVDESEEARSWREELTRRVTRPRAGVGEIEDLSSMSEFNAGIKRAEGLWGPYR